jgi:hypothetical protein
MAEIAEYLALALPTVEKDWAMARAWLKLKMKKSHR